MALARQQMQALRDKVPTRLQNSLLDPQGVNEVVSHFRTIFNSLDIEDRKLRRQKWLERMSDSNISYAAGHIKPMHSPPLTVLGEGEHITASPAEILQRLREVWDPIFDPADLPAQPDPRLYDYLPPEIAPPPLPPLTVSLISDTLRGMKAKGSAGPDGWR
eukprot:2679141-Amphidinium_carterae.1